MAAAAKVHALLVRTLAEQRRRDVADAHDLGHRHSQNTLNVIADRGYTAPGLAPRDDMRQGDGARLLVGLLEPVGQELGERRGREQGVGEARAQSEDDPLGVAWRDGD